MAEKKKKNDPLSKYERMKKLGLPMVSIVHKMTADGIEQSMIDEWAGVAAPASAADDSKDPEDMVRLKSRPDEKMKPFHWTKIARTDVMATVWEGMADDLGKMEIDYATLSAMFAARASKASIASPRATSPRGSDGGGVLDPKRCHTVMLGIKSMGLTPEQILDAILEMDEEVLTEEKVQALISLAPTDGELAMIRDYVKGGGDLADLNDAERFYSLLMDHVGIKQMLRLWLMKTDFEPRVAHLRAAITAVREALGTLKSARLRSVLKVVLAVGNYLNAGSHRGDAHGFHIETLDMIDGLKAADKSSTLLVFVVEQIMELDPEALNWTDDCEVVESALRITTAGVQREVDELKRDLEELDKRINAHKRTMTKAHSGWARDGGVVGLQHFTTHLRKASRAMDWKEVSSYSTLRAPLTSSALKLAEADLTADKFQKEMFRFYKRAKAVVKDVQTEMRGTEQLCRDLVLYFGCDEDTSWEEMFAAFTNFRQRFLKARSMVAMAAKKASKKDKSKKKAADLEALVSKRPKEPKYADLTPSEEIEASATHRRRDRGGAGGDAAKALAAYEALSKSSTDPAVSSMAKEF
jgi:hypothetical protein